MGKHLDNIETIVCGLETGIPIQFWGEPGTAKTATILQVAKALEYRPTILVAAHHDPAGFLGIPYVRRDSDNNGVTERAIPKWLKLIIESMERGEKNAIFFDEMNLGGPEMLKVILQVASQKIVGDYSLGEDFPILGASNPASVALYPTPEDPPITTRFLNAKWETETNAYINYFKGKSGLDRLEPTPVAWKDRIETSRYLVGEFISAKPELIYGIPESASARNEMEGYSTPRTWDYAAKVHAWTQGRNLEDRLARKLIGGLVGAGNSREFMEFAVKNDLGNPEMLLKNPMDVRIPDRGDKVITMLNGIVAAFSQNPTEERWRAAWNIIGRAFPEARSEAVSAGRKLMEFNVGNWPPPSNMKEILGTGQPENNINSILGGIKKKM